MLRDVCDVADDSTSQGRQPQHVWVCKWPGGTLDHTCAGFTPLSAPLVPVLCVCVLLCGLCAIALGGNITNWMHAGREGGERAVCD